MALPRGAAPAELPEPALSLDAGPLLAKEVDSLVQRLRLFTPDRWAAAAGPWGSRADLVRHLAQDLADAAAALEGGPQHRLPALRPDLLVADQLAVTGDDLVRAGGGRTAVDHVLLHRWELLGEPPPASLGGPGVLEAGRQACSGASRSS